MAHSGKIVQIPRLTTTILIPDLFFVQKFRLLKAGVLLSYASNYDSNFCLTYGVLQMQITYLLKENYQFCFLFKNAICQVKLCLFAIVLYCDGY